MTGPQAKAGLRADLLDVLHAGAAELHVALTEGQAGQLVDYVALLAKWNAVYNLTAIRDPRQMLIQHILDSLSIVPYLSARPGASILDVGSGGGLPGVVLAIMLPARAVTLNDIVQKKSAFQSQVKAELKLANLSVVTGRVETLRPGIEVPGTFDAIVSRAFADLSDFVTLARHLVGEGGAIWAMKGQRPDDEIARLPAGTHAAEIVRLSVPMLEGQRHLVEVRVETPAA